VGIIGFSDGGAVTAGVAFHYLPEGRPAFVAPIYAGGGQFKDATVPADAPPLFVAAATDDELGLAPLSPLRQRSVGMPEFFDLLREEAHPAVRVVLGHFIFVYIHP
jgi:hypothetical protein